MHPAQAGRGCGNAAICVTFASFPVFVEIVVLLPRQMSIIVVGGGKPSLLLLQQEEVSTVHVRLWRDSSAVRHVGRFLHCRRDKRGGMLILHNIALQKALAGWAATRNILGRHALELKTQAPRAWHLTIAAHLRCATSCASKACIEDEHIKDRLRIRVGYGSSNQTP